MKGRRTGSALIEFAASVILLSALFTGIFEFSYGLSTYRTLVDAVRAGARYASLHAPAAASADPALNQAVTQAVRNMVVFGDPAPEPGAKPLTPGLKLENVELLLEPATVTVSIRGFEISSTPSKIKLDGRPAVTFPRTPQVAR